MEKEFKKYKIHTKEIITKILSLEVDEKEIHKIPNFDIDLPLLEKLNENKHYGIATILFKDMQGRYLWRDSNEKK